MDGIGELIGCGRTEKVLRYAEDKRAWRSIAANINLDTALRWWVHNINKKMDIECIIIVFHKCSKVYRQNLSLICKQINRPCFSLDCSK